ncbi:MAG: FAD-binding protein [Chitinophagaceae bacterium]|nr:FAD-binding protein [Chitinophagaceae bacterium]
MFQKIRPQDLQYFATQLSPEQVLIDEESLARCASDHTEDFIFLPEVVLQPRNTVEVSAIMAYCCQHHISVTPRGAGTGISGGALAIMGGVVLDMRLMNKIIKLDSNNFQVTVEPGMITEELQNTLLANGLYYPPDPASRGSCFIGGNIAENSGGPRAVKYGVVKDYVLNLQLVLPNGDVIWTGANTLKNATGYNLTQLVVGSEGTLGIITQIVLRLIPAVQHSLLMLIPFAHNHEACNAVNTICMAGITPSALEFMERDALVCAINHLQSSAITLPPDINAHLLVELDGNYPEQLLLEAEKISDLMAPYTIGEILLAQDDAQKTALWQLRRIVGEAVKGDSIYKEEDTVVPRAYLPDLLAKVKEIGAAYGFRSVCYGHAGDGNLHVNIVKDNMSDHDWQHHLPLGIREIFTYVVGIGGTISGEHGIGYVQKDYLDIAFSPTQIALMRAIKHVFDPTGILNPGKIFAN